jgi:RNA polymerase sigma-70 factor (ECF subfamily)
MPSTHAALPAPLFDVLVAEARAGSRDALGRLLAPWWPWLARLAAAYIPRRLRAKNDPADLVQETMLEAQRGFARFHGRAPEALVGWLTGILRHRGLHFRRRFRGRTMRAAANEVSLDALEPDDPVLEALVDPAPVPSDVVIAREVREALDEALLKLPPDAQSVLRWRYWDGLSWKEIGRRLGCTGEAARQRYLRAIGWMQQAGVRGEGAGVRPGWQRARTSDRRRKAAVPPRWADEALWAGGIAGLMPWDPAGCWPAQERRGGCIMEWTPLPGMNGVGEVVTLAADVPIPGPWETEGAEQGYRYDARCDWPGPLPADDGRIGATVGAAVVLGPCPDEAVWQPERDVLRLEDDDRPLWTGRPDYAVCGPVPAR